MESLLQGLVSADGCWVSRRAFTDAEIYRLEQERIFRRTWQYLGHDSQLRNEGDFLTTYMAETPVIVARTGGEIVASVNSCTHRGMALCRVDRGNASRFMCPYHNWTFSVGGELLAAPQAPVLGQTLDKQALRLKKIPRIETIYGFIFGSLDPDIVPLDTYLGDLRFFFDALYGRFPSGLQVIGAPNKWQLDCNWKVPVENTLGDYGHGTQLHSSVVNLSPKGADGAREMEKYGLVSVPVPGHSGKCRLWPEGTAPELMGFGFESGALRSPDAPAHWREYLNDLHAQTVERLSPLHARVKSSGLTVYPNFATQWLQHCAKIALPRGPNRIEYWTWLLLPSDAPDDLKQALRRDYNGTFGPGGIVEQEDSFAWSEQAIGSNIDAIADDTPYFYGLGLGEEGPHPELPGVVGKCYNEHYARSFFRRWQQDLSRENGR